MILVSVEYDIEMPPVRRVGIWTGLRRRWPAGEEKAEAGGENQGPQEIGGLLVVAAN